MPGTSLGAGLEGKALRNSGFPRSIESIEKVLDFKIGFQDLGKSIEFSQNVH